ncbi:MAG: preprotein translocase subunit SecY [Clostridiales bacterium]|nr:preprotein translocase subunit SecY [Clostridiales bacterium]MBO5362973.1 preprotein translocase subunit SecY [Clostridia bacterium]
MLQTLINAFKVKEIRRKVYMMLLLLLVFRIGCFIPVPGLIRSTFESFVDSGANDFLALMSGVTGGALSQGTLFALGIGPYINASIIMQLLGVGIPALENLSKQGEEGRKKISQYTRYLTIVLAVVQSIGIIVSFANSQNALDTQFFFGSKFLTGAFMTIMYTAGALLVMWLGERITDYGVGNGQSMIIFVGIIATAGELLLNKIRNFGTDDAGVKSIVSVVVFVLVAIVIFFAIVYVDLSERRVPVQYAKQIKGRKMYGGQSSNIPIRIAGSGVMPLIFSFSILSFPQLIASMVKNGDNGFARWWAQWMSGSSTNDWGVFVYSTVLCLLIFAFSFFYAQMQFNPEDVSKNIQQNGGFIQGIRPGKATENYLKKISNRITLFGAIYLSLIAFVPSVVFSFVSLDLVNVFSTTGILIVVSCAMEFEKQLQAQLMMKNYKGFLK